MNKQWEKNEFLVSTDKSLVDLSVVHQFLSSSYWAKGIPMSVVEKSIQYSLPFGVYRSEHGEKNQIGFARVVSDFSTFAYLCDVFISQEWRGKGLSKWLMSCALSHPDLQGLRRFCLGTKDAHALYKKYGFEVNRDPQNWMEIKVNDIWVRS